MIFQLILRQLLVLLIPKYTMVHEVIYKIWIKHKTNELGLGVLQFGGSAGHIVPKNIVLRYYFKRAHRQ